MVSKNYIYRLFGQSPVRPLQTHMEKVLTCVSELPAFFEAIIASDRDCVNSLQKRISALENEADDLKRELRLHLPTGLMMPVSRRDLLEVLTMQDRVANKAKDIAGLIVGRKMTFPDEFGPDLLIFVNRSVDAARQAHKAINELDELVETGFRGSEVDLVKSMIEELNRIESDTDKIEISVRAKLFKIEKELPPIDVVFMYKIIDSIGDIGDLSQRVGSRLQLLLAR